MRFYLVHVVLLALVWAAFQGAFSLLNLAVGALLGALVLWFLRPLLEGPASESGPLTLRSTFRRLQKLFWGFELLLFFFYELLRSSLQVAREVVRPRMQLTPGIVALPLDADSDLEITVLANLISLTPGTLSLEVAPDRKKLYIHSMFTEGEDAAETRSYIKRTLERRVIRALGDAKVPDE